MLLLLLAPSVAGLPNILLYVLAVVIFLGVLWLILNLFPPTKTYASTIVLIVAGFLALYFVLSLLGAV